MEVPSSRSSSIESIMLLKEVEALSWLCSVEGGDSDDDCDVSVSLEAWVDDSASWSSSIA